MLRGQAPRVHQTRVPLFFCEFTVSPGTVPTGPPTPGPEPAYPEVSGAAGKQMESGDRQAADSPSAVGRAEPEDYLVADSPWAAGTAEPDPQAAGIPSANW
jgi:hypothetical protein